MSELVPPLAEVEKQIGSRSRELKLLRSLHRILKRKEAQEQTAAKNVRANQREVPDDSRRA